MRPGCKLERAELLGNHQRGVIKQHDPASADADRARLGGDIIRDQYARCGRCDRGDVVMLGVPHLQRR